MTSEGGPARSVITLDALNAAMEKDIDCITNEWRHSYRRWGKGHHDHAMQVIHIRHSVRPPQQNHKDPISCNRLLSVYNNEQHTYDNMDNRNGLLSFFQLRCSIGTE